MNTNTLEILLRISGTAMLGLIVANFVAAKRFSYAQSLTGSSTIVRQIFYVHCAYIIALIAGLALLCLGWPQLLCDGALARGLSAFFALFWLSRVIVQLTYYDKTLRRQDRAWDLFFLGVFLFFAITFTLTTITP